MKRIFAVIAMMLTCGILAASADNVRPISADKLPQAAQTFIGRHFANDKVAYVKEERGFMKTTYDVAFANGSKVEFDKDGEWREVECKYSSVPTAIVPAQIANFVKSNYPNIKILGIDRDWRNYEVKLSNGLEVKFDLKYNLVGIDD